MADAWGKRSGGLFGPALGDDHSSVSEKLDRKRFLQVVWFIVRNVVVK